jgi:ABC-type transport system involved in Fe-S cluster assembly fused permease/ATPase subunit
MVSFQKAERRWQIGITGLSVVQNVIFIIGLLAASILAVYEVTRGIQPVGSFITLLSYWVQLSGPLSFFANFYNRVQTKMIDAERLLELFETNPSITDQPSARELENVTGTVDFENVCFSYDLRKPTITNVNFHVPPGTTIAIVGDTGGGKTTCLKLLLRLFDVKSGSIKIDGHDIRDIKLASLRDCMGLVPQVG